MGVGGSCERGLCGGGGGVMIFPPRHTVNCKGSRKSGTEWKHKKCILCNAYPEINLAFFQ
jgi:hypothetical protein